MIIYATVLLGPGSEATVGDAIRSVLNDVDGFVLIESGGGDVALSAAKEAAGSSTTITDSFAWTGSYSDARQYAYELAGNNGADWALTLDPDERVLLNSSMRHKLEFHTEIAVWIMPDRDLHYFKERFLRCGAGLKWHGRVCENIDDNVPKGKLDGHFWEVKKTEEGERRRFERGIVECQRMIDEGDDRFKWWRHMGSCYLGVGDREQAARCFKTALEKDPVAEDRAWTTYLLCEQLVLDDKYKEATELAGIGLAGHAGFIPEFGWIHSYCSHRLGDDQNASRWAQLVIHVPPDRTRVSFRGQNCISGARSMLAMLHKPEPVQDFEESDFERRSMFADNFVRLAAALVNAFKPQSHLDLGAGSGLLVDAMSKLAIATHGVELSENAWNACPKDVQQLITFGVGVDGWEASQQADLVTCVEVLEHVPESEADKAVAAICGRSTRWVYFSAAAPGQPGKGHVNCKPKKYWRAKFEANGFRFAEAETATLVESIKDLQPCWWLPKNAMIFKREGEARCQ